MAPLCGAVLLAAAAFVLAEIVLRALGGGLGDSDELTRYAMAAWGLAWALVEGAHIWVEIALHRAPSALRDELDVAALASVAAVALTVAVHGWDVVATSLARGSAANTPLWIRQAVWWAGWAWFAVTATQPSCSRGRRWRSAVARKRCAGSPKGKPGDRRDGRRAGPCTPTSAPRP